MRFPIRLPSRSACITFLIWVAVAVVALALCFGAFFILFRLLLPFTLAWGVAFFLQPIVRWLERKTHLRRHRLGGIVAIFFFATIGTLFLFFTARLLDEMIHLFSEMEEHKEALTQAIVAQIERVRPHIPFLRRRPALDTQSFSAHMWHILSRLASQNSTRISSLVSALLRVLPTSLFSFVVFLLASVYLCADFQEVNAFLLSRIPQQWCFRLHAGKRQFLRYLLRYLRAYGLLLVLTFVQLLVGLSLLRLPYALGLAFLIACIDILPVLGVGTVLLPWGAVYLLLGNYYVGFGLWILFCVITVVRQVAEPHILGAQIGLHPLPTLLATYLGFRLLGFLGLLIAPLLFCSVSNAILANKKSGLS